MAFGFTVLLSGHCSYVTCHKKENVCNQNKQTNKPEQQQNLQSFDDYLRHSLHYLRLVIIILL